MIYCIPFDNYPKEGQFLEELIYRDENEQEWRIARVVNGFMVRYFGCEYFKENSFHCELTSGKTIVVKNTNCIFFQDADFETFCHMRDILKNGFTDEIWESLEGFFTERFEHDLGMIESEFK